MIAKSSRVHVLFRVSLLFKLLDGVLEISAGILLSTVTSVRLTNWEHLLIEQIDGDVDDRIVRLLIQTIEHRSSSTQAFAIAFLIAHGVVKIGLVGALWRNWRWAYPIAMSILGIFLVYQIYRFSVTHSIWLIAVSVTDCFVIVVAWLEYQRLRQAP